MDVGLLISGNLGGTILKLFRDKLKYPVAFVFTDSSSSEIISLSKELNIPCFAGNPRNGKATAFLQSVKRPDVILSVNYLFIVEADIINTAKRFAINIHGSLLPKYRGRTPHVWAIINNEQKTGITAHLIDEECDNGDIVFQEEVPILENYTGQDLLNIYCEKYPIVVEKVLQQIAQDLIKPQKQDKKKATYFGKRTASDGLLDWNWQRERINNWVRAQAHPYPGAFTFYKGNKITIHKIRFDDHGFDYALKNGTILDAENFIIKTPNGSVRIIDHRSEVPLNLITGEYLDERH